MKEHFIKSVSVQHKCHQFDFLFIIYEKKYDYANLKNS